MKSVFFTLLVLLFTCKVSAQSGCTDPKASNYNAAATTNNGTCTYASTNTSLQNPVTLPTIEESSGLIFTDGNLWTFEDSGNAAAIYKIDPANGNIIQTVNISNANNKDWEDITADTDYIYVGDFGNNANGNRNDLKIYKIRKADIGNDPVEDLTITVIAEVIQFSYNDQTDFTAKGNNHTKFDCEAFIVKENQLHLFTKDWITLRTKHYILSTTPGTQQALFQQEFQVNGLITGSALSTTNINEIVLIGYENVAPAKTFMWLLFDYKNNNFFSGNKRRIELGSAASNGQIEGITYISDGMGYISSEKFNYTIFGFPFTVPPHIYTFVTDSWIPLPVELVSFQATYSNSYINLSWQTGSETGNDFFTIERSTDGVNFTEIGRQAASGNSQVLLSYHFRDTEPINGVNYYRLKQTDLDGGFSYSSIQAATVRQENATLQVSPVPLAQGQTLTIEYYTKPTSVFSIVLKGMDGRIYFEKEIRDKAYIKENLSTYSLKPGLYILRVVDEQSVQTAKVAIY